MQVRGSNGTKGMLAVDMQLPGRTVVFTRSMRKVFKHCTWQLWVMWPACAGGMTCG